MVSGGKLPAGLVETCLFRPQSNGNGGATLAAPLSQRGRAVFDRNPSLPPGAASYGGAAARLNSIG